MIDPRCEACMRRSADCSGVNINSDQMACWEPTFTEDDSYVDDAEAEEYERVGIRLINIGS